MADDAAALRRDRRVVWRCGPDRVIAIRVGDRSDQAANELLGAAAVVWLALDEPATPTELAERLDDADIDADWADGLEHLRTAGLVVEAGRDLAGER